jgi:peptidoglycan/xylan/chitin deacetylase (PgdA/CDA1 family)
MRNALGLILGSVVAACMIAGGWLFATSLRADPAAPQATAAKYTAPLPAAPSTRLAAKDPLKDAAKDSVKDASRDLTKDDIAITGALGGKPAAAFSPLAFALPQKFACANADALGVSRVVEIDTTGGPGFGFEHFKQLDFLTDKEVVLTFDDGPWPGNTPAVLKALDDECTKALFFPIGKHATYHPEILRQVLAQGHTIGAHTWSHANLNSKKMTEQQAKDEVEKGFSAVKMALGTAPSPFFRFPELQHNPSTMTYLGTRNIAMFSCDLDSFDYKRDSNADKIVNTVMTKVDKLGKGIILMHDFQKHTAEALPTLLRRLKAGGYKVVQMKAKTQMQTLPQYDEALAKESKLPAVSSRPVSSVVQTVSQ